MLVFDKSWWLHLDFQLNCFPFFSGSIVHACFSIFCKFSILSFKVWHFSILYDSTEVGVVFNQLIGVFILNLDSLFLVSLLKHILVVICFRVILLWLIYFSDYVLKISGDVACIILELGKLTRSI